MSRMNTRQTVTEIAHRLPDLRRHEVREVINLLVDLWRAELLKPDGAIHIAGLGRLYVETHDLRATGAIRQRLIDKFGPNAPQTVQRRVIRFRMAKPFHAAMRQEQKRNG
jgi:nucleoid DNA-binding protein